MRQLRKQSHIIKIRKPPKKLLLAKDNHEFTIILCEDLRAFFNSFSSFSEVLGFKEVFSSNRGKFEICG